MSRKRTVYTAEFKTKIVLEVLKGEETLNEIASKYKKTTKNIQNWKSIFLSNAVVAMEPARAVKEYKEEIEGLKAKNDEYAKIVGKLTVENNWMSKKLKSLDSKKRQAIVEFKLSDISITRQSELLGIARSGLYYLPKNNEYEISIKNHIQSIYNEIPMYGYLKVHKQLLEDGFRVSVNTVQKYRQELGLKAVLAVKALSVRKTLVPASWQHIFNIK